MSNFSEIEISTRVLINLFEASSYSTPLLFTLAIQHRFNWDNAKKYPVKFIRSVKERGIRDTANRSMKKIGTVLKPTYHHTVGAYFERQFDRKWGIETAAHWDHPKNGELVTELAERYEPTSPAVIEKIMRSLGCLTDSYLFFDIGCGKGRVLVMASTWHFKRVVGIEFSKYLADIAVENVNRFKEKNSSTSDIDVICEDATAYDFPDEDALIFLFNPFKEEIMRKVLENIRKSARTKKNRYIIYHNPVLASKIFSDKDFVLIVKDKYYSIYKMIL